jgi:hypothetical protein
VEAVSDDEAELSRGRLEESDFYELLVALTINLSDVTVRFSLSAPNKTAARVGEEAVWFRGGSEP